MTRIVWDWAKGPPPCRPGESDVEVNLGTRIIVFRQAVKMRCPFCGVPVIRAPAGNVQDPNIMQRYYYEARGSAHWNNCTEPQKARLGFKHPPRVTVP